MLVGESSGLASCHRVARSNSCPHLPGYFGWNCLRILGRRTCNLIIVQNSAGPLCFWPTRVSLVELKRRMSPIWSFTIRHVGQWHASERR